MDTILFIVVLYQASSSIIDIFTTFAVSFSVSLPASDIDNIVMLMRKTNFKFLLDLNLQLRYGIQWNPTNAASLLAYVKKMNYSDVFNFELGNGVCARMRTMSFKFAWKNMDRTIDLSWIQIY